ncbi:hypothetical protein [Roseateles sp. L2-2]
MQMNPYESGAAERVARTDTEMAARVQAIEAVLPTLATRAQLEQLRGEMKEGFGELRAEMKEGLGALRADMYKTHGDLRVDMRVMIASAMKWSIGMAVSLATLGVTVIVAIAPLITTRLHG